MRTPWPHTIRQLKHVTYTHASPMAPHHLSTETRDQLTYTHAGPVAPHQVGERLQSGVHVAAQPSAGLEALGLREQGRVTEHPEQVGLHVALHTPVFNPASFTMSQPSHRPCPSQSLPDEPSALDSSFEGYVFGTTGRLFDFCKPCLFTRDTAGISLYHHHHHHHYNASEK